MRTVASDLILLREWIRSIQRWSDELAIEARALAEQCEKIEAEYEKLQEEWGAR